MKAQYLKKFLKTYEVWIIVNNRSTHLTKFLKLNYRKISFGTLFLSMFLMSGGIIRYLYESTSLPFLYPVIMVFSAVLIFIIFLIFIQLREVTAVVVFVFTLIPLILNIICLIAFTVFIDVSWIVILLFSLSILSFLVSIVLNFTSYKKIWYTYIITLRLLFIRRKYKWKRRNFVSEPTIIKVEEINDRTFLKL